MFDTATQKMLDDLDVPVEYCELEDVDFDIELMDEIENVFLTEN